MPVLNYKWIPAASTAFKQGRGGFSVRSIIMHSTEGRCTGDISTLTGHDPGHNVSVHWYITRTGDTYHFVQNSDTAYHAGVVRAPQYDNFHSIGIEHEHFDGSEDWPDAQIAASALVVKFLGQQFPGIEIAHHADVAAPAGRKTDPIGFPSDRFWAQMGLIKGYIQPMQV